MRIPRGDVYKRVHYSYMEHHACRILSLLPARLNRTVIQAGGNVGVYPREFAKRFKTVLTFEPHPENFECLRANCAGIPNIEASNCALGEEMGERAFSVPKGKSDMGHVVLGSGTPVIAIDSLDLHHLDFICLDLEGFEWPALKGAERAIKLHRPHIVVEIAGHFAKERYGYTYPEMFDWLRVHGYTVKEILKGKDWLACP